MNQISMENKKCQAGFTLIECLLAIAILSLVLISIISLQSSVVSVTYQSINKIKSTWAMKKTFAQLDYVVDVLGMEGVPESKEWNWSQDESFQISLTSKEPKDLKLSDFLITAYKFYNFTKKQDSSIDIEKTLAPFTAILDQQTIAKTTVESNTIGTMKNLGPFLNVNLTVNWTTGKEKKHIEDSLLLIRSATFFNLKLPTTLDKSSSGQQSPSSQQNKPSGQTQTPGGRL